MAIISPRNYDAQGRLVRPSRSAISSATFSLDLDTGGSLTFDRDHVHVFTVTAAGLNPAHARDRINQKLRRFFDRAEAVRGYRKLSMTKREGVLPANGNTSITYEIVYAIERESRSRGTSPESPYAGSQRVRPMPVS